MSIRNTIMLVLGLFLAINLNAQDDKFMAPVIEDEMTINPEQNSQWRMGQAKFPAKPKNMWELGLNAGLSFFTADVETPAPGYGFGLHLRKSLGYVFSLRFEGLYTVTTGLDARATSRSGYINEKTFTQNGGANGPLRDYITGDPNATGVINRNFRNTNILLSAQGVFNIGNILFHKERNRWGLNAIVGFGLNIPKTKVDLLAGGGASYDFVREANLADLTTKSGRKDARSNLKDLLDGDYETDAGVHNEVSSIFGDERSVLLHLNVGAGVAYKLSKRLSLGLEYEVFISDNDLLDGWEGTTFRGNDIQHFTSLRLGIALGSFEKRVEPLYWVNPLDATMNDIAELKQRPKFDLTDSDGDGVIDMIDQEKDSPAGCPVDTRGVVLDSDGDGVIDCKDEEPYSPPGYDVDARGVAQVPKMYLTESEINNLITERTADLKLDWFLPMIHFDLDKYYIKPEFYGHLAHVAQVMKSHPNLKVVATGFTDNRKDADYNNVLSYNRATEAINYIVDTYGIPRDRFYVNYDGLMDPIVPGLPPNHNTTVEQEHKHYMNRRVEFRVAMDGDRDMSRPEGPDAGSNTPGSSRPGAKYSGNRNSGY